MPRGGKALGALNARRPLTLRPHPAAVLALLRERRTIAVKYLASTHRILRNIKTRQPHSPVTSYSSGKADRLLCCDCTLLLQSGIKGDFGFEEL